MKKYGKITLETLAQMVKEGFDEVNGRLNIVDKRLTTLESDVENIKLRLDEMPYRFEFKQLEKRVLILEKRTGVA